MEIVNNCRHVVKIVCGSRWPIYMVYTQKTKPLFCTYAVTLRLKRKHSMDVHIVFETAVGIQSP